MKVFLSGFGVVGQATAQMLAASSAELSEKHGLVPRIVGAADKKGAALFPNGIDAAELLARKRDRGTVADGSGLSVLAAVEESDADVVVESAPTDLADPHPAIERLQAAFRTGKHAVCVNKAPLAIAMPSLLELAEYNKVIFRFSGTVGGGTPVLDWAMRAAEGDRIERVRAILNGTTNYMLTRMGTGVSYDAALAEAQEKGYAETDPSMDVDGVDAGIKLVILANAVMGRRVTISDVSIKGIRGLSVKGSVRLICEIGDSISVAPREVEAGSPLLVTGTLNCVQLSLRNCGDSALIGKGAGGKETATSIVRDLITIWHRKWEGALPS